MTAAPDSCTHPTGPRGVHTKSTPQQEPPPLTQVTTRDFRTALAAHLASHDTTLVLKRNTPIAVLLPLYLPPWPTIPHLRKARTRTLRRVRRLFDQLLTNHAH